jgi:serine/threonine protein kinase
MLSNDESEWYSISEEALHAGETVFMDNKPDNSEINPSRPITDFLHGTSGIEKYSVYDEIGRGAMSVILKAADKNIRREIAMKVLPKAAGHEKQARFMEEAQVIGQLEHPNIIPIHDIGVDPEGRPFFTMKLVKGRSLGDILEDLKSGKREAEEEYSRVRLLRSMVAVCNAVAFAHSKGVIHRDLKPDNIMVGDFGEVLVMDWGLARIIAPPKNSSKKLARSARMAAALSTIRRDIGGIGVRDTMDGNIVGTPLYMSPEQARGEVSKVDMRSDIYGLGAILYEIVTLLPPIKATR